MISLFASQSIKFYKTLTNIKIANPLLSGSRGYFKLQNDTKISLISSLEAKIWLKNCVLVKMWLTGNGGWKLST